MTNPIQENIYRLIENTGFVSGGNRIFIVGKGPSIDEIAPVELSKAGLIINLNDSEKIIQGHLGIFSGNWVRHSLKDRGFMCSYYLAGKPLAASVQHSVLPPIPFELDDEDLSTYRLSVDEYYDEPFVLLNALKVCRHLAQEFKVTPEVYLLGFDFSTAMGEVSKNLGVDFARTNEVDRNLVVHSQESAFLQFQRYFSENSVLKLVHVGAKEYSKMSSAQFRALFSTKQVTAPVVKPLAREDHVLIVAEFTNNHLGDLDRLLEMVERAKAAGADLVKVQKRHVETFYSKEKLESYYWSPFGKTLAAYRKGVELDEDKLAALDERCKAVGIGWFCSVLDYQSFEGIRKFNLPLIKIPSTISNHREFHKQVAQSYQGPIVVSTGYTTKEYEDYVLETFRDNEFIYLLHCISAYPTPMSDCNVAVVSHYADLAKKHKSIVPGYSSHDIGSLASVLAVASGARMIEKHVKLGDVDWVHFDKVALDLKTDSFERFVRDIRDAELALGSSEKRILPSEHHKYEVVKDPQ